MKNETLKEIRQVYKDKYNDIQRALISYRAKWETGSEEDVLAEMLFCILTPQSKAKGCWSCMESIIKKGLLLTEKPEKHTSEAKARDDFIALMSGINPGPTARTSFSASCKVVPFQNIDSFRSYPESYAFHLMLQPMEGRWSVGTGLPAITKSMAKRRSFPVTGIPLPGRLASNWPR